MKTRGLFSATKRKPRLPPGDNVPKPSISTDPPCSSTSRSIEAIRRARAELVTWIPFAFSTAAPPQVDIVRNRTLVAGRAEKFPSRGGTHCVLAVPAAECRRECHPIDRRQRRLKSPTRWPGAWRVGLSSWLILTHPG